MTLECESFQAGRISNYLSEWRKITSDPQILSYVTGVEIERKGLPQEKESLTQRETRFTDKEKSLIEEEISSLLRKKVIETAKPCVGEVISPIFLTPKLDESYRMMLNLKKFNKQVVYRHFKMDTLNTIVNLMSKDCYMASLDLKDAYYSVPISKKDRKFLRFRFYGKMLQYTSLANGLGCCPRLFTKILLQVSRRTVSWFHLINSQDTQDDMTEKTTNPVENEIDNPVIMTYPVDNPIVKKY